MTLAGFSDRRETILDEVVVTATIDTKLTPITNLIRFNNYWFELVVKDLATENADKFDVKILAKTPAGNWIDIVYFTQLDGDGSDSEEIAVLTTATLIANAVGFSALTEKTARNSSPNFDELAVEITVTSTGVANESATISLYMIASGVLGR